MVSGKRAAPRLTLNDDGSNFLYSWDDLTVEDLRAYLSRLQATQVDMVAYCVAFGGYVAYYDSRIAEPIGTGFALGEDVRERRWAHNLARLRESGGDYLGHVFAILEELGIPAHGREINLHKLFEGLDQAVLAGMVEPTRPDGHVHLCRPPSQSLALPGIFHELCPRS